MLRMNLGIYNINYLKDALLDTSLVQCLPPPRHNVM